MESMTKNKQNRDVIRRMTEKYMFPHKTTDCAELTEGMFNAAYEVYLDNGSSVILKIAPPKEVEVLSYEKNIMHAEVQTMNLDGVKHFSMKCAAGRVFWKDSLKN